jgi:arylsulfatase A
MITRREFLSRAALISVGSVLPNLPLSTRPNVILIMADDLGHGSLGCYGQQQIQTPNIDTLAAGGMRFTQTYSPAPVCSPTRWSLLTGNHTGHAHNTINLYTELEAQDLTFPELLQAAGYETAIFGKWGVGTVAGGNSPIQRGFDHFLGYIDHIEAWDYYPPTLWRDDTQISIPENQQGARGLYIPDLLAGEAIQFMARPRLKPFFLYLPFTLPHANGNLPWPELFQVPSDAPYTEMPWPQEHKNYAAMVTHLDSLVGTILQALEGLGIAQNTLVIFASDNGSAVNFFGDTGGLRGEKATLHEGGIRIPLLVKGPGIAPGVSSHACGLYDLAGTILEAAGVTTPAWDSLSFWPLLQGRPQKAHEFLYWAFTVWREDVQEAVRLGNWKGIRTVGGFELYNLASDPGETTNLAGRYPDLARWMEVIMDRFCPAPKTCRTLAPVIWR